MLVYKTGDILQATENIICHQCNYDIGMKGGLALQIAKAYPQVEQQYNEHIKLGNLLLGDYQVCMIGNRKYIANCFTQENFNTNYEALIKVFNGLLESCRRSNLTIAVPYKYGCGIANGDWNIVSKIFGDLSNEYQIDINIYKLEEVL